MKVKCRITVELILAVILFFTGGCGRGEKDIGVDRVTVWAHHGQERENAAMKEIVSGFNEVYAETGPAIEITFFPDDQYADKVSIASAAGSLPDVVEVDGPFVGPWAAEGLLAPIDDLVGAELRKDFLSSVIEQGTYQDNLYTLGAFDSALVVYYNRDMIETAGLNPPGTVEEAWTWEEFIEALRKVKTYAEVPVALHMDALSDEWFTYAFTPLIWSNGGRLLDTGAGQVVGEMNSEATVDAIRKWKRLFEQGLAQSSPTIPDPFSSGQAAFDWTGHWMLRTFEETEGLRFGVTPLPKMGDRYAAASGSWCWGISSVAGNPEQAWEVIRWFLHPEHGIRPIVEANGAIPARRSAFKFFSEFAELPRRLFREQLESAAHPRPRTPVYFVLTREFARALRDISLGASVEESLTGAAKTVQATLDRRK